MRAIKIAAIHSRVPYTPNRFRPRRRPHNVRGAVEAELAGTRPLHRGAFAERVPARCCAGASDAAPPGPRPWARPPSNYFGIAFSLALPSSTTTRNSTDLQLYFCFRAAVCCLMIVAILSGVRPSVFSFAFFFAATY